MNYTKGEWEAGQGIIKGFEDTEHIVVGLKGTNNTKIICATGFSNAKDVEELGYSRGYTIELWLESVNNLKMIEGND